MSGTLSHFKRKQGFLSCHCSGKGPHLVLRRESCGFSRVVAGCLGFLSNCDGDLRDPLVLPQRSQVSVRVARGTWGFLSSRCPRIGPCLEFSWETHLGLPIKVQLGSQDSSGIEAWNSAFLSSCQRGVRPLVEFRRGI